MEDIGPKNFLTNWMLPSIKTYDEILHGMTHASNHIYVTVFKVFLAVGMARVSRQYLSAKKNVLIAFCRLESGRKINIATNSCVFVSTKSCNSNSDCG